MSRTFTLTMTVNGTVRTLEVHPMTRLLDVLRDRLGLTGAKEGCGEGECGACAVLMNGRLVTSCLVPASQAHGAEITTIEGLAKDGALTPLQDAFIVHNATQCGFCTPGMLLAAEDLLRRCPAPDEQQVRRGIAGNLCRCTGYVKIVDAVQAVGAPTEEAPR
ncbi:MAG TPA: (2Fe-2S)-binding protein [Holophaga sp.]|nr:(2Fe-2S)-binding protein [Holophaga sp.]